MGINMNNQDYTFWMAWRLYSQFVLVCCTCPSYLQSSTIKTVDRVSIGSTRNWGHAVTCAPQSYGDSRFDIELKIDHHSNWIAQVAPCQSKCFYKTWLVYESESAIWWLSPVYIQKSIQNLASCQQQTMVACILIIYTLIIDRQTQKTRALERVFGEFYTWFYFFNSISFTVLLSLGSL